MAPRRGSRGRGALAPGWVGGQPPEQTLSGHRSPRGAAAAFGARSCPPLRCGGEPRCGSHAWSRRQRRPLFGEGPSHPKGTLGRACKGTRSQDFPRRDKERGNNPNGRRDSARARRGLHRRAAHTARLRGPGHQCPRAKAHADRRPQPFPALAPHECRAHHYTKAGVQTFILKSRPS